MKYERLTIRNSDGSVSQPTHSTFEKVFNRLAELEDKIEQGLMKEEKTCVFEEWQDVMGDSVWQCSNCKEDFCFIEGNPKENMYGYCPNCGARLTGLKEMQE